MSIKQAIVKDVETAYIESVLVDIQRLKADLVTQIAHEFRTPLTSVLGFAEMLLDDRPLSDEQRVEYARFIQYEGIRLSKLIDDLLELASFERGYAKLDIQTHSLRQIILEAIAKVSDFARGRLVTVQTDIPDNLDAIRLDGNRMTEVAYQLLHNAVRFTKPRHEVRVRAKGVGRVIEFSVQDSGSGIPEKDLPTLFERFGKLYRADGDLPGTGVGLVIVKHIVDLHGGTITVDSVAGKGSTFTVQIPSLDS